MANAFDNRNHLYSNFVFYFGFRKAYDYFSGCANAVYNFYYCRRRNYRATKATSNLQRIATKWIIGWMNLSFCFQLLLLGKFEILFFEILLYGFVVVGFCSKTIYFEPVPVVQWRDKADRRQGNHKRLSFVVNPQGPNDNVDDSANGRTRQVDSTYQLGERAAAAAVTKEEVDNRVYQRHQGLQEAKEDPLEAVGGCQEKDKKVVNQQGSENVQYLVGGKLDRCHWRFDNRRCGGRPSCRQGRRRFVVVLVLVAAHDDGFGLQKHSFRV